jgi:hypothetical protein
MPFIDSGAMPAHRWTKQAIVSSVGPYKFSTTEFGAAACHRSAVSLVSGSPQKRLHRRLGMDPAGMRSRARTAAEGTENHDVSR